MFCKKGYKPQDIGLMM